MSIYIFALGLVVMILGWFVALWSLEVRRSQVSWWVVAASAAMMGGGFLVMWLAARTNG